uniref:Transmembrane protein 243 n=1 Tax=Ficedula albicollis TaxID=59894 RepID=U3JGV1_FICAL
MYMEVQMSWVCLRTSSAFNFIPTAYNFPFLTSDFELHNSFISKFCSSITLCPQQDQLLQSSLFNFFKSNFRKMSEVSKVMTKADIKPKSMHRAKIWSDDVENLYRFQQAGYRDEVEYKQVKQVDKVECWPETGFVKKLQRRDNTFYYYNRQRECEDKDVHKVKIYVY